MRRHDTILIGRDAKGEVRFVRSYEYETEKDIFAYDLAAVREEYPSWTMANLDMYDISRRTL